MLTTFISNSFFNSDKKIHSHIIGFENVKLHNHSFIEFFYVISGKVKHNLNGNSSIISTGDAFLLSTKDTHQFLPCQGYKDFMHRDILISLDYFIECCNLVSPELYNLIIDKKIKTNFKLSTEQMQQIEQLIPSVTIHNKDLAMKSLVIFIINNLLITHFGSANSKPSWIIQLASKLSAPDNLKKPLTDFTSSIHFSNEYMCRKFKKYMGITMTDYFNKQKLEYALTLLLNTDKSISEIQEYIGINNTTYFYKLFKSMFGKTPGEVRK